LLFHNRNAVLSKLLIVLFPLSCVPELLQALLKAKHYSRVVSCTHQKTYKTHVTLTFGLWPGNFSGCRDTCSRKISSS